MEIDLANLPTDAMTLQALVRQLAGAVNAQELKIAQLEARIARLKRMQFGRSSEKIAREIEQLELELDDLHEDERAGRGAPRVTAESDREALSQAAACPSATRARGA